MKLPSLYLIDQPNGCPPIKQRAVKTDKIRTRVRAYTLIAWLWRVRNRYILRVCVLRIGAYANEVIKRKIVEFQ